MSTPTLNVEITCPPWGEPIARAWFLAQGVAPDDISNYCIARSSHGRSESLAMVDYGAAYGDSDLVAWLARAGIDHDLHRRGMIEGDPISDALRVRFDGDGRRVANLELTDDECAIMIRDLLRAGTADGAEALAAQAQRIVREHGAFETVQSIEQIAERGMSPYTRRTIPEALRCIRAGEPMPGEAEFAARCLAGAIAPERPHTQREDSPELSL